MSEQFLVIKELSKDFGGIKALDFLNLDISQGEIHGLIGPNGAGKTTLINLITGLEKPTSGIINFQGERIDQLSPEMIFEMGISRTFQDGRIVSRLTVFENIATGLILQKKVGENKFIYKNIIKKYLNQLQKEKEIRKKVEKIIEKMGLLSIANRWGDDLVWFERQLVQITRAIISDPQFLLLDEPTAGMGIEEKRHIEEKLRKINQSGVTILVVSHDMNFIRSIAQKITVLDFGRKISEGFTEQVLSERRVWEAYLGSEAKDSIIKD